MGQLIFPTSDFALEYFLVFVLDSGLFAQREQWI
jgi:hypothetical protein